MMNFNVLLAEAATATTAANEQAATAANGGSGMPIWLTALIICLMVAIVIVLICYAVFKTKAENGELDDLDDLGDDDGGEDDEGASDDNNSGNESSISEPKTVANTAKETPEKQLTSLLGKKSRDFAGEYAIPMGAKITVVSKDDATETTCFEYQGTYDKFPGCVIGWTEEEPDKLSIIKLADLYEVALEQEYFACRLGNKFVEIMRREAKVFDGKTFKKVASAKKVEKENITFTLTKGVKITTSGEEELGEFFAMDGTAIVVKKDNGYNKIDIRDLAGCSAGATKFFLVEHGEKAYFIAYSSGKLEVYSDEGVLLYA